MYVLQGRSILMMGQIGGSGSVCTRFPVPPIHPGLQFTPGYLSPYWSDLKILQG